MTVVEGVLGLLGLAPALKLREALEAELRAGDRATKALKAELAAVQRVIQLLEDQNRHIDVILDTRRALRMAIIHAAATDRHEWTACNACLGALRIADVSVKTVLDR